MKKVLRWIKRIVLGVIALAVLAVIAAIIIVHTDWGREQIRKQVEKALAGTFPGGAHIGKLEGSIFGTLTVTNIELDGADGKPLISVGKLELQPRLLPLLSKNVRVDSVIATDVVVDWRVQPSKPSSGEPKSPTAWSIDLEGVEVHRGKFSLAGKPITLDGLELGATFQLPAGKPLSLTAAAHGTWVERKAPFQVTAAFQLEDGVPVVPSGSITVGDVSITATNVRGPTGTVVVRGTADAIAALEPRATLPGDVLLEVSADSAQRIGIRGAVGPTPIEGLVQIDPRFQNIRGFVTTHDVDLDTVTRGKLHGTGSVAAVVVSDFKRWRGTIVAQPRIATVPAETVVAIVDGTIAGGGRALAFATGPGDLRVTATGDITRAGISRSTLVASIADPSVFLPDARGAVRVRASAAGAFTSLGIDGSASGSGVAYKEAFVSNLEATFSTRLVKPRPYGNARVIARGIANAGSPFGNARVDIRDDGSNTFGLVVHADPRKDVEVDLDARATPRITTRGLAIGIDLGTHRVNLPTVFLSGVGGHVEVLPDKVVVTDLRTSSGQGGVDVLATYRRTDKVLTAALGLTQVELEEIIPTMRGHLDGSIAIEKHGPKWTGKVDIETIGLSANERVPPVNGTLKAELVDRRLTMRGTGTTPELGAVDLIADLQGPKNIFDIRGWQHVPRGDVHLLEIDLHDIRPGVVDPRVTGTLTGKLALSPTTSRGTFEVRGVTLPWGTVDVDSTVSPAPNGELGLSAQAKLSGVGTVDVGARIALPDELLDAPSWIALGRNALRGVSAQIDEVAVDPAMLARFKLDLPYKGRATLQLAVGPGGESTKLALDLGGVSGGVIAKPVDVHAEVTTSPDGTGAFLSASSGMKELMQLGGQVPVTFKQWLQGGWANAKQAELTGSFEIPAASAVELLAIIGRSNITQGQVSGKAEIGGTLGTPTGKLRLAATGIAVAASLGDRPPPVLEQLVVEATWGGASGHIEISGDEVGGGRLQVTADGRPDQLAEAVANVDIAKLDLVPVAAFLPGPYVSLAGVVEGKLDVRGFAAKTAVVTGALAVTNGRIPLSPKIGTLQKTDVKLKLLGRTVDATVDGDLGVNHATTRNVHLEAKGDLDKIDATGHLFHVSPINKLHPTIDADVEAHLERTDRWTGTVKVSHGVVFVPSEKGTKLLPSTAPDDLVFVDKPTPIAKTFIRPPPEHPTIAIHLDLRSTDVEVEEIAHASVSGRLDITLGGGGIGMLGQVDVRRGRVDLFQRSYDLEHGQVSFDGTMDGLIDVQVVHDFPDMTLVAVVNGRVSDPQIELSSTPATYTRGQLLGFLLGGEPGGDANSQTQEAATGAAAALLSSFVGSRIKKVARIGSVTLIDTLRCEAQTSSTSSSCTVGRWFGSKLFVSAKANLEARPDENRNEGEAQYYMRRNILLELIGGDNSHHSLDLLWRKRW